MTDTPSSAESLFFAWLEHGEAGQGEGFEALLAAHPREAAELAALHRDWQAVASLLVRTDSASAAPLPGIVQLDSTPPEADGSVASSALRELLDSVRSEQRYQPVEVIGSGGMATVLNVWDTVLRRKLAMKVARSPVPSAAPAPAAGAAQAPEIGATVGRFLEEAQVTGQLNHPGVVPVHDLGVDRAGRPFFTMRLVQGRDLRTIFRVARAGEEGWSLPRAVRVLHQVCQTVSYAHAKGVVHRDLKPANVMVGSFGETYVMDWGLAKVQSRRTERAVEDASTHSLVRTDRQEEADTDLLRTLEGTAVGTPCYMAPEQAEGRQEDVGPRSDVYAVGAMLYELLTGQMPYCPPGARRTPRDVLRAVRAGPPAPVLQLAPEARPELAAVCAKAMARDPGARYAGMRELGDDLAAWLDGRVVRAYETGFWAELRKWVRRNRGLAAALLVAFLSLVGGSVAFALVQQHDAARLARQNYVSNLAAAERALQQDQSWEAAPNLEGIPEAQRGWEWRHLASRLDRSVQTLEQHQEQVRVVTFTDDGVRFATASWDHTVKIWDARTQTVESTLTGHQSLVLCADFDARGELLATGSYDQTVRLWDARSGAPAGAPIVHGDKVAALQFAPDGASLASAGYDGVVRIWSTADHALLQTLRGHSDYVYGLAYAPDGRTLLSASFDRSACLWDPASGALRQRLAGSGAKLWSAAWSRDGRWAATGAEDGQVLLWDMDALLSGARPPEQCSSACAGGDRVVVGLAFNRDGSLLAGASWDGLVRLWDVPGGNLCALLNGHRNLFVWSVAFAPPLDGSARERWLYSGSGDHTVKVWDTESRGRAVPVFPGPSEWALAQSFSPDGRMLAVGYQDGTVQLLDPASGAAASSWRAHQGRILDLEFSADGRWLVSGAVDDTLHLYAAAALAGAQEPQPEFVLRGHGNRTDIAYPSFFSVHPDSRRVALAGAGNAVLVWELPSGRELQHLEGHAAAALSTAYSPDGRWLASTSKDGSARLWDAETGALRAVLPVHTAPDPLPVTAAAFSPDSRRLVTGCWDGDARLWQVPGGRLLATLHAHQGYVTTVAWHPDGSRIVTGSLDSTIGVWDAAHGDFLLALHGHSSAVADLCFSPDGRTLASSSLDHSLRLWLDHGLRLGADDSLRLEGSAPRGWQAR